MFSCAAAVQLKVLLLRKCFRFLMRSQNIQDGGGSGSHAIPHRLGSLGGLKFETDSDI